MRVPKRFADVARRGEIHRSPKTDSERRARELQTAVEAQVVEEPEARLLIRSGRDPSEAYRASQDIVKSRGLTYKSFDAIVAAPLDEILARLDSLSVKDGLETARAILGGVEAPSLGLSDLAEQYTRIMADANKLKNERQMRVWKNA